MNSRTQPVRPPSRTRDGAIVVEMAVIVSVLLLTLFVMLDLALAVLHYNCLSEASRRIARAAIVRGENAPLALGQWGPAPYSATAADDSEIPQPGRPALIAMDPAQVAILLEWPDGDCQLDDRVRVSLEYDYDPLFDFGVLDEPITLSASSTMRIEH